MTSKLKGQFETTIKAAFSKEFGAMNAMAVPRIVKVTVNVGISASNWIPAPAAVGRYSPYNVCSGEPTRGFAW